MGAHAWPRRRAGQRVFSLCGITHTVSTRRIMEGLFDTITGPTEEWDAIICTSKAVHSVVDTQLDEVEINPRYAQLWQPTAGVSQ